MYCTYKNISIFGSSNKPQLTHKGPISVSQRKSLRSVPIPFAPPNSPELQHVPAALKADAADTWRRWLPQRESPTTHATKAVVAKIAVLGHLAVRGPSNRASCQKSKLECLQEWLLKMASISTYMHLYCAYKYNIYCIINNHCVRFQPRNKNEEVCLQKWSWSELWSLPASSSKWDMAVADFEAQQGGSGKVLRGNDSQSATSWTPKAPRSKIKHMKCIATGEYPNLYWNSHRWPWWLFKMWTLHHLWVDMLKCPGVGICYFALLMRLFSHFILQILASTGWFHLFSIFCCFCLCKTDLKSNEIE